jgi:alpha-tubulin suppressor-like RCC1 family protein
LNTHHWTVLGMMVVLLFGACSERSDSEVDSGADGDVFECGVVSWLDPESGLCWQQGVGNHIEDRAEAFDYCCRLKLGEHDDWRVPTIEELRTLVRGCPASEAGGACGVDDDGTRPPDADLCDGCDEGAGAGNDGCYWPDDLGGYCDGASSFTSATMAATPPLRTAAYVGFSDAKVWYGEIQSPHYSVRCVRSKDESRTCEAQKAANELPVVRAVSVSVGTWHSCAVDENGSVRCWGGVDVLTTVDSGLGDGNRHFSTEPIEVFGAESGVLDVSAGDRHTCLLTDAGRIKCWGDNYYGQLGLRFDSGKLAAEVIDPDKVRYEKLFSGASRSCGISAQGDAFCWGTDLNYTDPSFPDTYVTHGFPTLDDDIDCDVDQIASPHKFSCALCSSGIVKCKGRNDSGMLGLGTFEPSSVPQEIIGIDVPVVSLSSSWSFSCAVLEDGRVMCWGLNWGGSLGCESESNYESTPCEVSGLDEPVVEVATGSIHTCARTESGRVLCWGGNDMGELGIGTADYEKKYPPSEVLGLNEPAVSLSCSMHCCVVLSSGAVRCWGDNRHGQLGNGMDFEVCWLDSSICYEPAPVSVVGFGAPSQ